MQLNLQPLRPQTQGSPLLEVRRTARKPGPLWQSQVFTQTILSMTPMMSFLKHQRAQISLPCQIHHTMAPLRLLRTQTLFPKPLIVLCGLDVLKPHQMSLAQEEAILKSHQLQLVVQRKIAQSERPSAVIIRDHTYIAASHPGQMTPSSMRATHHPTCGSR